MNTLRRVGLVVISCIILLLALLCPVSAASFIEEDVQLDNMFDSGLMLTPNGTLTSGTSTTDLASSPNYPDFNPNMIPWKDSPDYVKSVLIAYLNDFNKPGNPLYFETPVKVPFVCVRVNGSNVMVYVGWNISVVNLHDSNRPVIGRFVSDGYVSNDSSNVKMLSSTLYRATYNLSDMSLITPWYDASSDFSIWDTDFWSDPNKHSVFTYTGALVNSTNKYDLYFYGSNYCFTDASNRFRICSAAKDSGMSSVATVYLNYPGGFSSSLEIFYNDYPNTYCQYFVPKIMPDVNTGIVGDHSAAEDELVNGYNPDNLSGDINIEVDASAWQAIFSIFNLFISGNAVLVHLIVTMLSLGFIALLLNR